MVCSCGLAAGLLPVILIIVAIMSGLRRQAALLSCSAMPLHSFSDLTRQTAFMRLWYSRLASISGQQMLMVAVGWQMYELTGSAWDLGLVGLF